MTLFRIFTSFDLGSFFTVDVVSGATVFVGFDDLPEIYHNQSVVEWDVYRTFSKNFFDGISFTFIYF